MKQAVEEAMQRAWNKYRNDDTGVIMRPSENFEKGFTAGIEWQKEQSPWTKVSDGLPSSDGYYLITDGMNLAVAYFFKDWGKFAKYREYPHPLYDDGVVKLYMSVPPISLTLEGDRGILNIGQFKRKEIDYERK